MIQQDSPPRSGQEKKTVCYTQFRGVDFSTDPSLVADSRSPYAPNLISDIGGRPEKRLGWRTLYQAAGTDGGETPAQTGPGPVNGLFQCEIEGEAHRLAHIGTKLYRITAEGLEELKTGLTDHRSVGFFLNGKLYLLTGGEYLAFDGETVKDAAADAYVPTTLISVNPDGSEGAAKEAVNLLTGQRTEQFYGDETSRAYHLSQQDIDSVDKVEVQGSDGAFTETTAYTADLAQGVVTFSSAHAPVVTGEDNIKITYTKATDGNLAQVTQCQVCTVFTTGANRYVFFSGNPEKKAYEWRSAANDPTYIPDINYSIIGSEETAVMGYLPIGRYLVVVKEENGQDTTLFNRWANVMGEEVTFQLEPGAAGVGALSQYAFGTLLDEPLFLSRRGVFGVTTTNILAERAVKNRSFYVDAKLITETNLAEAAAVVWNGYYILAVNNRAYILDSKNKSLRSNRTNDSSDYIYECYHWENLPARCFLADGDDLYFGTADGRVCRMNTDRAGMDRFSDDGAAIVCCWSTKNDDDGKVYLLKSMQKRGCSVTVKPFYRSSAKIYLCKDGEAEQLARYQTMDIFNFFDLDFERFSFLTNDSPQEIYLKKKVKKYKRLQIIVKNDGVNEGFGIYQISKTYVEGNFAKK